MTSVFSQVDEYAPGFSDSVVGYDALAPPDLERIFGLTGGLFDQSLMNSSILVCSVVTIYPLSENLLQALRNDETLSTYDII